MGSWASPARGDPTASAREDAVEDARRDGDIDEADLASLAAVRLGDRPTTAGFHGRTWVSLVGFSGERATGRGEVGGMLVVGVALDRIAAGTVHRVSDADARAPPDAAAPASATPPAPAPDSGASARAPPSASPPEPAPPVTVDAITGRFARACVAAALRTAGLGSTDARLDALVSRARASAWLPEARVRAMRLWHDASRVTSTGALDASFYDAVGANLLLELRLTWQFDRLLYAGDEPTIERVRLERQEARARVAARVLDALFAWDRARLAEAEAASGTRAEADARLRVAEAEATLDVLTGGWFASQPPPLTAPAARPVDRPDVDDGPGPPRPVAPTDAPRPVEPTDAPLPAGGAQ